MFKTGCEENSVGNFCLFGVHSHCHCVNDSISFIPLAIYSVISPLAVDF